MRRSFMLDVIGPGFFAAMKMEREAMDREAIKPRGEHFRNEEAHCMTTRKELAKRREARINTSSDLEQEAVREITGALNLLLADVFTLYLKTKNFHWHMSGPHFRDYHLLLDQQAEEIFDTTDEIAERVRKIGGITIRSIGEISKISRIRDNDATCVDPRDMLSELREDNKALILSIKAAHSLCDEAGDIASASLFENWADEAQRRVWFLFESTRTER